MLILILTVIMCCVKTNSICLDFCDCSKKLPNTTDDFIQLHFTENQKCLVSLVATENGSSVSFPDSSTVTLHIIEINFNFSNVNLNWIKRLVISENNLTAVPEFISVFNSVEVIDLSKNEIDHIDENSLRTLNLNVLNVSKNVISSLSNISCGLNSLTNLDISYNNVADIDYIIDLPNLQYLNLSSNNLKVLNSEVFINLKMLQCLDVSRNRLVRIAPIQLQNLVHFSIADNYYLGKSREIYFVGNGRKIQILDASRTGLQQVPAILTHSIQYLILKKNSIETINSGDLDSYPLLNSLDIISNNIKFIEEDSLGRLEFLSVLYLTDNQLEEIPRRLPEKLKVLHLDINKIGTIRKKDLQGLSKLEMLFLNDNNISVIKEGAFSELISLVSVDLSRNPIINLRTGILTGPLSLKVLQLASVQILSVDDTSFPFSAPEHLVTLNLSSSPGLAHQFLSDTATLMAAKRLQELDLTGGNLRFIRQDLQFYLPQLESLHINGNELNTSQIDWLKSWLCARAQNKIVDNNSTSTQFFNTSTSPSPEKELENDRGSFTEVELSQQFSRFKKHTQEKKSNEKNKIMQVVDSHGNTLMHNVSVSELSANKDNNKKHLYYTVCYFLLIGLSACFMIVLYTKIYREIGAENAEVANLPTISYIWW